jgi:hypothetical protein
MDPIRAPGGGSSGLDLRDFEPHRLVSRPIIKDAEATQGRVQGDCQMLTFQILGWLFVALFFGATVTTHAQAHR